MPERIALLALDYLVYYNWNKKRKKKFSILLYVEEALAAFGMNLPYCQFFQNKIKIYLMHKLLNELEPNN
jgi:hypothetical protein